MHQIRCLATCILSFTFGEKLFYTFHFWALEEYFKILCSVDCASSYSLTNNPTRCTILFKYIYLYLFSTCFGHPSAHHWRRKLLYLCDTGICHFGWVASGVRVVLKLSISIQPADQTPTVQSDKYQCRIDTVVFLLMMGTWMPKTCREEIQINIFTQNCAPSWIICESEGGIFQFI